LALLELTGVEAHYGPVRALRGVSLAVEEGEIVSVLGANGAGKTTTLRAISGMVRRSGEIVFAGARIDRRPPHAIARAGVAHVPEGRGIVRELTVRENLRLGTWLRRDRAAISADFDRVGAYFPVLARRHDQLAGTLSGGEQQRLALARALLMRPRLLLLDEPSLGLAPTVVRELYDLLSRLNREDGLTVVVVEQNAHVALQVSSRAYVLETGRVVLADDAASLRANDSVRRAYLGY